MEKRFKRSWTSVFIAAGKLRDFGWNLGGTNMEKLTIGQERVLQVVFQHSPKGIMLKDIAKEVKLTPGAVSQTIEMLVKDGLVERVSDSNDRRAVNIRVSPKCEEIRNYVVTVFDQVMESILQETTPAEGEAFLKILDLITHKLSNRGESTRRYAGETLLAMEELK